MSKPVSQWEFKEWRDHHLLMGFCYGTAVTTVFFAVLGAVLALTGVIK
jgi:hypothetical protein